MKYRMNIAGLDRDLPLCKVSDDLYIGAFVMFGDAEITVACATCKGSYEQMGDINAAISAWVAANGFTFDGPMFNIYHVSPHETDDPNEYVTEVCYPVKKR